MRTQSVNSAEKNNTNVIAAGAGGAGIATLASRFAPLTAAERASAIFEQAIQAKDNEFKIIVDEIAKNKEISSLGDIFTSNKHTLVKGNADEISKLAATMEDSSRSAFEKLAKRIQDAGQSAAEMIRPETAKGIKKSRPALYFAILVGAASMTAALVKNAITMKKVQDQTVAINYDKEGMIIDAPDSLSLAIVLDQYA